MSSWLSIESIPEDVTFPGVSNVVAELYYDRFTETAVLSVGGKQEEEHFKWRHRSHPII